MSETTADRRKHRREASSATVQFFHGPSRREFPGRCLDISEGGLMMYVPAAAPVQAGQAIRLQMPQSAPLDARIVRVDRQRLLSKGHIAVGVQFG